MIGFTRYAIKRQPGVRRKSELYPKEMFLADTLFSPAKTATKLDMNINRLNVWVTLKLKQPQAQFLYSSLMFYSALAFIHTSYIISQIDHRKMYQAYLIFKLQVRHVKFFCVNLLFHVFY